MANDLKLYDPFFYANEALIQLEKALGMASTVHRGYEKSPQTPGSTIKISRPSTFVAETMPIGRDVAQDVNPDELEIKLDQWKGVQFKLTDLELTYATEKIITDHIRPAAYAVADAIDADLTALYADVPEYVTATATPTDVSDLTALRRKMFDNKVPNGDRFLMLNGEREEKLSTLSTFVEAHSSSDGAMTQREGFLGRKFGMDIFANQNVKDHSAGTVTASAPVTNGAKVAGDVEIVVDDATLTGDVNKGDIIELDGHTQKYSVTEDATAAANAITIKLSPALQADVADGTAVTFVQTDKAESIAYHRNCFALAMAPLTDMGSGLGARIGVASDPVTNLALRSSVWYEAGPAEVYVRIDALWGRKTLDPRLGVRYRS